MVFNYLFRSIDEKMFIYEIETYLSDYSISVGFHEWFKDYGNNWESLTIKISHNCIWNCIPIERPNLDYWEISSEYLLMVQHLNYKGDK